MKTQKSIMTVLSLLITCSICFAQESVEKEVNEQVWKPFTLSWQNGDATTFNDLHTDDVLRASAWNLKVGQEYKESNTTSFAKGKERGDVRTIQFWFEHRVYSGDTGYEVGYYKITSKLPGTEGRNFYARFHIVLKKVNGKWKIAQDWDTSDINGHKVSEEDWLKGKAINF